MHDIELQAEPKQLARQMRGGAGAGRSVAHLAGVRLDVVDEVGDRLRRHRRMDQQNVGRVACHGNGDEILVRVVGDFRIEARIDHIARRHKKDRVAIGRCVRRLPHAGIAASAGDVLHIELLARSFRQLGGDQPGDYVGRAACSKRHNDLHGPVGVIAGSLSLGGGGSRPDKRRCHGYDETQIPHLHLRSFTTPIALILRSALARVSKDGIGTCRESILRDAPPRGRAPQDEGVNVSPPHALVYSILMCAARTTLSHLAISLLMRAPNSAGVVTAGSKPRAHRRSFTSGSDSAATVSRLMRTMMSLGVPAGANRPLMVSASWSGTPASAMVGTSGSAAERFAAVTASARRLPSLMLAIAGGNAVNAIGVWPASVEFTASEAPLNGTVTRSSPYWSFSSSPDRCGVDPVDGCA